MRPLHFYVFLYCLLSSRDPLPHSVVKNAVRLCRRWYEWTLYRHTYVFPIAAPRSAMAIRSIQREVVISKKKKIQERGGCREHCLTIDLLSSTRIRQNA